MWRLRGCLDRDLPSPDLGRWWSRLLRRDGLDTIPDQDHPAWTRWERLTANERSTTSPQTERVPEFKLREPGKWLLAPEECRTLTVHLRHTVPSGHNPDKRLVDLAERFLAWLDAADGDVTCSPGAAP